MKKVEENPIVDYLTTTRVRSCSHVKCVHNLLNKCDKRTILVDEKGKCRHVRKL